MAGWNHKNADWKVKICPCCKVVFKPASGVQKYCSSLCKKTLRKQLGKVSTEEQYKKISGNWSLYFSRLLSSSKRKEANLTRETLLELAESQNYKCALSGLELTCQLEKGSNFFTNASVDRVIAGGCYTKENIQLVCKGLNSFRNNMPLKDFIDLCTKVSTYQSQKDAKFS